MILIVIGAFGTVLKVLERKLEEFEIGGRLETIQTTALLRSKYDDHDEEEKEVLYILPMNINGYVPFLINTLDTIVSKVVSL